MEQYKQEGTVDVAPKPVTISAEEKQKLQEFYLICPKGHEVDHIRAIAKGGLHHPDNLQILTVKENRKKWMK